MMAADLRAQREANMVMTTGIDWAERAHGIAAEIRQYAAAHDDGDSFVSEGYAALKREGFLKALVPEEQGGHGARISEIGEAIRILAQACGSTALAFSMHSHLVATAAWRLVHQSAPTEGLLRSVAAEDLVLVSSGGSDWLQSGGTATQTDGGYLINARKPFSSGSPAADLLATSAVYEDPDDGPTVLHFAVPLKADGVEILETWRVLGMRGTGSNDIMLKDVFVSDAAITGRRPRGKWHLLFHAISMIALPLIYSAYAGIAEAARDKAIELAKKRPPDRHLPILVGEMENALRSALLAHARMMELADHGSPGPETTNEVTSLRTLVGDAAIRTVERAMMVAGGSAYYRSSGLERAFRDVQASRYHPLQEKVQLEYAGRMALGLDIDG
jgi:acyl-CoA dehydrogenase